MLAKNAPHLMRPIASVAEFAGSEDRRQLRPIHYQWEGERGGGVEENINNKQRPDTYILQRWRTVLRGRCEGGV